MIFFINLFNLSFIKDKRVPILLKSIQNEIIQINLRHTYHKKIAKVYYTIIIMISDFKATMNYNIFFIHKKNINIII